MKYAFLIFLFLILVLPASKAQSLEQFFKDANSFFSTHVADDRIDYQTIKNNPAALNQLIVFIEKADVDAFSKDARKAFGINSYNIMVVKAVVDNYPLKSPLDVGGFFDEIKYTIAGKKTTLNNYEKKELLQRYGDARLHFVLVCAAVSCPPLADFAYMPAQLEEQLDARTKAALNNSNFIQMDDFSGAVSLSKIFEWYAIDFQPDVVTFINQYRTTALPTAKPAFYPYNWTLNDQKIAIGNTAAPDNTLPAAVSTMTDFTPIIAAATMPANTFELNTFHTLFTANYGDKDFGIRSSYFSSLFMFSYGLTGRFDIGLDFIFRSFRANDIFSSSPFRALAFKRGSDRVQTPGGKDMDAIQDVGLTHAGPRIRFAPFKRIGLSFEQAFYLPVSGIPANNTIDQSIYWVTQFYYDKQFDDQFGLFIALTFWQPFQLEQKFNFQTPYLKAFFSWYTTPRFTVYATTTSFTEWGAGAKFLITPQFEVQALYTYYIPIPGLSQLYTGEGASNVMTFNLGIRYRTTIRTKS